jgi:hypothetical protein
MVFIVLTQVMVQDISLHLKSVTVYVTLMIVSRVIVNKISLVRENMLV